MKRLPRLSISIYLAPLAACALVLIPITAASQCGKFDALRRSQVDLTELTLSELMNVEITSVAKKPQPLREVPAPVFVITQEDIRRSGVTTIPEALRMAPGMEVARVNSHGWAISARGFNNFFADKLLVLLDGRNVYTPLFGGVFWDVQDTLLEDIDRIEVIRGPGGTIWGANAVNGVVNIITKCAADTQGGFLTAGVGTEERMFGGGRYGFSLGEDTHFRAFVKGSKRDDFADVATNDDSWEQVRGGFRGETSFSRDDVFTVQGDVYLGNNNQPNQLSGLSEEEEVTGANVMARWTRKLSDRSYITLQSYYDFAKRDSPSAVFSIETLDFDLQHRFGWTQWQELTWGVGYRMFSDDIEDTPISAFSPPEDEYSLVSAFIQDEITLLPEHLRLVLGSKFEHNDFSGFEYQPTARLLWTPTDNTTLWGAVSRAVNTPSRSDQDIRVTIAVPAGANPFAPVPLLLDSIGNTELEAESAISYELGIRSQVSPEMSWDLALYYTEYEDIVEVTTTVALDPTRGAIVATTTGGLLAEASTHGAELSADLQVMPAWRMRGAYTYFNIDVDAFGSAFTDDLAGRSPRHQVSMRSSWDLGREVEFDLWFRYVDELFNGSIGDVDAYVTADARLAWQMFESLELSLVGRNLLQSSHLELGPDPRNGLSNEVERSIYGQIRLHF